MSSVNHGKGVLTIPLRLRFREDVAWVKILVIGKSGYMRVDTLSESILDAF